MEGSPGFCAVCGTRNDPAARFCMSCGSRMEMPASATRAPEDVERKVITALFCDVVGSTELGERLDPEDIDRLLRTYHGLARRRIEANGGVVEKFIGDAVVGIFGAPAAHEDDPSRAVRAALRIIREIEASPLDLHVRIGVYTGETLVRVGERTAEEGFATGDCLNTAARLQGVAPIDGVAVGDPTYRLTRSEFEWEDLGPAILKGKAQPVQVWRPVEARVPGGGRPSEATPFVGREAELSQLERAFERSAADRGIAFATVIAEPGLGKSRLIRELARRVAPDDGGAAVTWRTGRCLPYGDGVSFWALGEIVKSHAGILDTDDQAAIGEKLDKAIAEPDQALRRWLRDRLAPLVGLRTDAEPPPREEAFAAWRRFLLSLAASGPAVVVVEDLHWADDALVAFLLELAEVAESRPLLVVVTSRPELAERHPAWLARARQATLIQLVSLDDGAIAEMIESTLAGASVQIRDTVLERAAGSPLYAEQLAALIRERGLDAGEGTLDERAIPATIQALLAARIDSLPRDLKPRLLDAAVVGRVFWSGAVATLEGEARETTEPVLIDLARHELTRRVEPSTMLGEAEYSFWHALLRDVAYSFLPRTSRLTKHRLAAAWITDQAKGSLGDVAEIVADHERRALELAEALADVDAVTSIRSDLAGALVAAAARSIRVVPLRAEAQLEEALSLMAEHDPRRADALATLGQAYFFRSELRGAERVLGEAQHAYRASGRELAAAELAVLRARALQVSGNRALAEREVDAAQQVLEGQPGVGLVALLALRLQWMTPESDFQLVLERAGEVAVLADRLGIPEPAPVAFARGRVLLERGDRAGEAEVRRGIAAAIAAGDNRMALMGLGNLANLLMDASTPAEALAVYDEAFRFAEDHGLDLGGTRASRLDAYELAGEWDRLLAEGPLVQASAAERGDVAAQFLVGLTIAGVHLARGEAIESLDHFVDKARQVGLPVTSGTTNAAVAALARGDATMARTWVEQGIDGTPPGRTMYGVLEHVSTAIALGDLGLAHRVLEKSVPPDGSSRGYLTLLGEAIVAEAEADPAGAGERFRRAESFFRAHGWVWYHAFSLAGAGRCELQLGAVDVGLVHLAEAREIAERLRANVLLDRIDAATVAGGTHGQTRPATA